MARQLVYEGPDLQQLLQQVIDEHGPARIHPPERRRKGGVLGFFAREVYVITVDVDAPSAAQPTPGAVAAANGMPDGASRPGTPLAVARAEQTLPQGATARSAGTGPPPGSFQTPLAALVESTEDVADLGGSIGTGGADATAGGAVAPKDRRASNGDAPRDPDAVDAPDGSRTPRHAASPEVDKPFGEVLSEVASSLGEEPGTYRPDPERLRRPRRPQAEADTLFEVSEPVDAAPAAKPAAAPTTNTPAGEAPAAEASSDEAPAGEPAAGQPQGAAPPADGAALAEPEPVGGVPTEPVSAAPQEPEDTTGAVAVQLPLIGIEEEPPDLGATIVDLLRAAGFPDQLLPHAPLATELSTIEAVFGALSEPPPLPTEPGGLVAVVGSAGLVRPVANAVALAVGSPRDEVAVASSTASDRHARPEYRARTAAQAASMSPGWRRDRVGVVAVYAPPLGADQRWTRQVLRALRPSCVWGMASATTKPDDVRRWITAIGGVNALVMTEVGATATPAAILSLGIPVARLDDEPATPTRWASIVANLVTKH